MSRIPRATARRIDRLAWRAHLFHRWAHHPLCAAYRGEVLKVGRVFLCKGCALVGLGVMVGSVAGALAPLLGMGGLWVPACLGVVWGCGIAAWPAARRAGKLATRTLPMAAAAFLVVQAARHWSLAGATLVAGVIGALVFGIRAYWKRGPWRAPCTGCPELDQRPCSGFRRQYRREKAFGRLAGWVVEKAVHHEGHEGHKER